MLTLSSVAHATQYEVDLLSGHTGPGMMARVDPLIIDVSTCSTVLRQRLFEGLCLPMKPPQLQRLLGAAPHGSWKAEIDPDDVTVPCSSCHYQDDSPGPEECRTAGEMLQKHPLHLFVPVSVTVTLSGGTQLRPDYMLDLPFADEIDLCEEMIKEGEDLWGDAMRLRAEFWRLTFMAIEQRMQNPAPLQSHEAQNLTAAWRFQTPQAPLTLAAAPLLAFLDDLMNRPAALPG